MTEKMFASWAQGFSAANENPRTRAFRQAFGVTFTLAANTDDFFHLALPTPVLVENVRATLDKVMILFNAQNTSFLFEVLVFDGPRNILTVREFQTRGDHAGGIDNKNSFSLVRPYPSISFGVGITLHVSSGASESKFFISSYGGDFLHNL